jgi:8-oxo-dGTP diphosphatase
MNDTTLYTCPHGWVSVKEDAGFYYAERRGRDSVAIVLTRNNRAHALVRWHPLIADDHRWHPCPITGSMEYDWEDAESAARREVLEETGYVVGPLTKLTTYIVGTQTNELCHLFTADVTGQIPGADKNAEMGEAGSNQWVPFEHLKYSHYSGTLIAYALLKNQKNTEEYS